MSDNPDQQPTSPTETGKTTNISGGVNVAAQRDVKIGGDVAGRDITKGTGHTAEQVSTLLNDLADAE